jgi:hypothetical protein
VADFERRLRRALGGLPDGPEESRRRAERAALDALPSRGWPLRRRWTVAVAAAVAAVVAGAGLAATDRLAIRLGEEAPERQAARAGGAETVRLPAGHDGLALVAGGRLWLGTRAGLGVQGLAASAAELSPNATYAAVGIGRSLVAMTPGGRPAWTHPAGGRVVAAAWAPNPIVVAYVVRRAGRHELRVIEGDGDGDRLVDPDVAPVRPSWRADTGAVAYVARGGQVRVAAQPSLAVQAVAAPTGGARAVAFAPSGRRLAIAAGRAGVSVVLTEGTGPGARVELAPAGAVTALSWSSPRELLVAARDAPGGASGRLWSVGVGDRLFAKASGTAHGPAAEALAPLAGGGAAVAVRAAEGLEVWEVDAPSGGGDPELRPRSVLLRVPAPAGGVRALSVR